MKKTVLNWSSGKDAALTYHILQQSDMYEVTSLLTTVNAEQNRIVMHGVREELLDLQAERMGVPMRKIQLPPSPNHDEYNKHMSAALDGLKTEGIVVSAFGDIHLADLKQYREEQLTKVGLEAVFPLWQNKAIEIVKRVEELGIEAIIICVNEQFLGKEFLGRKIDVALMADLPDNVDPCGEYGEFHTFVYNAPYFSSPISIIQGEIVHKSYDVAEGKAGFYFMDIMPTK